MKLTRREQILLYFLGCFILVMVGAFVLALPQMDRKNEAEANVVTAQNRLISLQSTINQYGDLDSAITERNEQIVEIEGKFYHPLPNEDVDQLIKTTLTAHKMTPLSMDISTQENYPLSAFDSFAATQESEEDTDTGSTITLITINVSFSGDRNYIAGLVNDIASLDAYQIGSLNYDVTNIESPITMTFKLFVL